MSKNYSQVGEGCDGENPRISQKCPGTEVTSLSCLSLEFSSCAVHCMSHTVGVVVLQS